MCAVLAASLLTMPDSAQAQNPIQAIKDAFNKAKQQAKPPAKPAETPATPANPSAATPTPTAPEQPAAEAQNAATPWTPPADAPTAPVKLDPSKMPDVVGVRLGMTAMEGLAATKKQYPTDIYQKLTATWWPETQKPDYGYTVLTSAPGNAADVHLSFTAPPGPQYVWRITRFTNHMNINHSTLLAALRAKYGKETLALPNNSYQAATDDKQIAEMYWLFNERGERVPLPPSTAFANGRGVMECWTEGNPQPVMPVDAEDMEKTKYQAWCGSMVGLHVTTTALEIVQNTFTEMIDAPLALRTARAAKVFQANVAEEERKKAVEKSKTVTPVL